MKDEEYYFWRLLAGSPHGKPMDLPPGMRLTAGLAIDPVVCGEIESDG